MKVFNNFWPLDIWKGSENVTEGPPSTKSVDIEQCSRIIPCKINTFRKKKSIECQGLVYYQSFLYIS